MVRFLQLAGREEDLARWDAESSNEHLRFAQGGQVVTRPGRASSVPCAVAVCAFSDFGTHRFCVRMNAGYSSANHSFMTFGLQACNHTLQLEGVPKGCGGEPGTVGYYAQLSERKAGIRMNG